MAHQAHNIPWGLLTSNLEWKTPTPWNNFATNLYPRMKPNQANDLTHFVNAFVKNLDEHSVCERKKYPEHYDAPQPSDVILDDVTVRKISPTVRRWRGKWPQSCMCPSGKCRIRQNLLYDSGTMGAPEFCKCEPIPQQERLMSAFLREPMNDWRYTRNLVNDDAFFNIQILQTLILYGEMEPILRICAHPVASVRLKFWFQGSFFKGVSLPPARVEHC